jgi:hypothetical protein
MANETTPAQADSVEIGQCADMKNNLINAGTFIKVDDAAASLQAYLDAPGTPPKGDLSHIYGHIFGLNTLRTLLTNIDGYNGGAADDKKVTGIRIYYGIAVRHDANFPLKPPHRMYRDLIFMPVLPSGEDLYPIDPQFVDPQLILSESRPCPTQCPKFLDKI